MFEHASLSPPKQLGLHVSLAIARRELRLAGRRKLVRALFIASLIPLLIFALIIIIGQASEQTFGAKLEWDPVHLFLKVQTFPVLLLSMALGAPMVAEDRAEDVLFLYATRRVSPWDYALGKFLAIVLPCFALLALPGLLMAGLRWGVLSRVGAIDSAEIGALVLLVSALIGVGYAGVALAASVLTQRSRWALLTALALFFGPDMLRGLLRTEWVFGPMSGGQRLIEAWFSDGRATQALTGSLLLLTCATLGLALCALRVRKEMIP